MYKNTQRGGDGGQRMCFVCPFSYVIWFVLENFGWRSRWHRRRRPELPEYTNSLPSKTIEAVSMKRCDHTLSARAHATRADEWNASELAQVSRLNAPAPRSAVAAIGAAQLCLCVLAWLLLAPGLGWACNNVTVLLLAAHALLQSTLLALMLCVNCFVRLPPSEFLIGSCGEASVWRVGSHVRRCVPLALWVHLSVFYTYAFAVPSAFFLQPLLLLISSDCYLNALFHLAWAFDFCAALLQRSFVHVVYERGIKQNVQDTFGGTRPTRARRRQQASSSSSNPFH